MHNKINVAQIKNFLFESREKEKLMFASIFSFSQNVFRSPMLGFIEIQDFMVKN